VTRLRRKSREALKIDPRLAKLYEELKFSATKN